jgi:plasmid stabilization system protein ParE
MVKRKIIWTKTAALQRREILKYWTERNGNTKYAEQLIQITSSHIKVISNSPNSFKQTEIKSIHESAMGHFSIYYKITADQIIVLAFWDNRQSAKKLLKAIVKSTK